MNFINIIKYLKGAVFEDKTRLENQNTESLAWMCKSINWSQQEKDRFFKKDRIS